MREDEAQRAYWNALAEEYRTATRIDASDFHYGPRLAGERTLRLLPPLAAGMTALELGCGAAQNSVWLAGRGLRCLALDVSDAQIAQAQAAAVLAGVDVACVRAAIEDFSAVAPGPFDFIHSSHAFEFIDDPGAIVSACAAALKPGGWLMVSTVHPVYNGEWIYAEDEEGDGGAWGRFLTSYFAPPDDVRTDYGGVTVRSRAWPMGTWFRWFKEAGLVLENLVEPPAAEQPAYTSEAWEDDEGEAEAIPTTVIFLARRPL